MVCPFLLVCKPFLVVFTNWYYENKLVFCLLNNDNEVRITSFFQVKHNIIEFWETKLFKIMNCFVVFLQFWLGTGSWEKIRVLGNSLSTHPKIVTSCRSAHNEYFRVWVANVNERVYFFSLEYIGSLDSFSLHRSLVTEFTFT